MAIFALLYANNVMFLVDFVQSSNISLSNFMHETLQMIKKQQHLKRGKTNYFGVYVRLVLHTQIWYTIFKNEKKQKQLDTEYKGAQK